MLRIDDVDVILRNQSLKERYVQFTPVTFNLSILWMIMSKGCYAVTGKKIKGG